MTVPLDPSTNVGLSMTASGIQSFCAFCTTVTTQETIQPNIFSTHIIPDKDVDEYFQPKDPVQSPSPDENNQEKSSPQAQDSMAAGPQTTLIDLGPITHVIPEDQDPTSLDLHDKLLRWHYRLGHLPFEHIKQLVLKGQLPKCLLASKKAFCSACQYDKMTKRPWRVKETIKMLPKWPHGLGRLFWWTNWSPTLPASFPSSRASLLINDISTRQFCRSILRVYIRIPPEMPHK